VTTAGHVSLPAFDSIAWLMSGCALALLGLVRMKVWVIPLVILGGCIIGVWRASISQAAMVAYQPLISSDVRIEGTVKEDADIDKSGNTVLRLNDIMLNDRYVEGTVWVTTGQTDAIRRSDKVTLIGRLSEGFGNFSGSIYRARIEKIQRAVPGDVALSIRDFFAEGVRKVIPDTEASLGLGYLVGQRRGLPDSLDTALQAAGLTHIVVASGYNLTILVRLSRRLFQNVSKYLSALVSGTMIVGFIGVTGLSPSMSRAGLVAGLSLVAWYYGKRFHPLVLLPFSMAITVVVQPSYAWGDLAWQLSFAAFAGVMILAPLMHAYFFGDKKENMIRRIFIETIAATVSTLPIIILSFGQFSMVAPIANMAILPLVPVAMLLTFIAGVAGLALPGAVAEFIGLPATLLLRYMVNMAELMGGLPWALQNVTIKPLWAISAYALIIAACIYMKVVTKYDLRSSSIIE